MLSIARIHIFLVRNSLRFVSSDKKNYIPLFSFFCRWAISVATELHNIIIIASGSSRETSAFRNLTSVSTQVTFEAGYSCRLEQQLVCSCIFLGSYLRNCMLQLASKFWSLGAWITSVSSSLFNVSRLVWIELVFQCIIITNRSLIMYNIRVSLFCIV